jgi:hypothetical protein
MENRRRKLAYRALESNDCCKLRQLIKIRLERKALHKNQDYIFGKDKLESMLEKNNNTVFLKTIVVQKRNNFRRPV